MKVLHVTAHLGGGVGKAISGLINAIDKNKIEHEVLILEDLINIKYKNKILKNGIKIVSKKDIFNLKDYLEKFDEIVINWWNSPAMVDFFLKIQTIKVRIILWCHVNGCTYPYLPAPFLESFNKVLFTSKFSYENSLWSKKEVETVKKISKIVYGFGDFCPMQFTYKKKYTTGKIVKIAYVGTLNYSKMNRNFVSIAEKILDKNRNIEFYLFGEAGDDILFDIYNSRYKNNFILKGYCMEVNKELVDMDIFGYILENDNYGTTENVLLEAMSAGLPIIALNQNSEKYIIKNQYSGLLVNGYSEYVNKLLMLCNNKIERELLGRNARKAVCNNFNFDKNINEYINTCYEVLKQEKKCINFSNIIGDKPIDYFMYFSGKYKKIINDALHNGDGNLLNKLPPIFMGNSKGSIINFSNVFYFDSDLLRLRKMLQINNRKEKM